MVPIEKDNVGANQLDEQNSIPIIKNKR